MCDEAPSSGPPLLEVRGLSVQFGHGRRALRAVDGLSFLLNAGESVGLVGESGCGKSATALALLGLIDPGQGSVIEGEVLWQGQDLLSLDAARLRQIRGDQIAMVFQEPLSALNPVLRVGAQVAEALLAHRSLSRSAATQQAVEMLRQVGISSAEEQSRAYPHQLSGGMRQRVLIAMALACEPNLLVADEPTTALDVTLQAQVLALLRQAQQRMGMSLLFISHDLGLLAEICERILVLYAGQLVEAAPLESLFSSPRHPYTAALLKTAQSFAAAEGAPAEIPGTVPDLANLDGPGCRFADRCERFREDCQSRPVALSPLAGPWQVRCLHPLDPGEG